MEKEFLRLKSAQDKSVAMQLQMQNDKRKNPSVSVNPLTPAQLFDIASESYCEVKAFRESTTCSSTGVTAFGWRERHAVSENQLLFSLDKVIRGQSVKKMALGIWQVVSNPELIKVIPDADADFYVIERPNEDAVVFYYTLEQEDSDVCVRAFILSLRIDLGAEGCVLIFRTLEPTSYLKQDGDGAEIGRRGRKKIEPQNENVRLDAFVWSLCELTGDLQNDECRYTYGGKMNSTAFATAGYWYLQMLKAAMTMENQVAGTQGLLWH